MSDLDIHFNWDDVKVLLTLAREGSAVGAAEALGVSHQTISRRLGALETEVGLSLINRDDHPWTLTPTGQKLAQKAQTVKGLFGATLNELRNNQHGMEGRVTISCVPWGFEIFVLPVLVELKADYPLLQFDLISNEGLDDIQSGKVDIALRFSKTPPQDLLGKNLGVIDFGVFGTRELIQQLDGLEIRDERASMPVVDFLKPRPHRPHLEDYGLRSENKTHVNDFTTLVSSVVGGVGIAVIPKAVGQRFDCLMESQSIQFPASGLSAWSLRSSGSRGFERLKVIERALVEQARMVLPAPK